MKSRLACYSCGDKVSISLSGSNRFLSINNERTKEQEQGDLDSGGSFVRAHTEPTEAQPQRRMMDGIELQARNGRNK